MIIKNFKEVDAIDMMAGVKKRIVIGKNEGAPNFVMRVFELEPGVSSPFHDHPWEHEIFVLQGSAAVKNFAEEEAPIAEGDTVFIESGERHCLVNKGEGTFRFICLIPTSAAEQ